MHRCKHLDLVSWRTEDGLIVGWPMGNTSFQTNSDNMWIVSRNFDSSKTTRQTLVKPKQDRPNGFYTDACVLTKFSSWNMLFEMALNLKCAFSAISKNIVLKQLVNWHSHMTSDVLGVFLTYLPTLIRCFTT